MMCDRKPLTTICNKQEHDLSLRCHELGLKGDGQQATLARSYLMLTWEIFEGWTQGFLSLVFLGVCFPVHEAGKSCYHSEGLPAANGQT